jgi:hypothetical protein
VETVSTADGAPNQHKQHIGGTKTQHHFFLQMQHTV